MQNGYGSSRFRPSTEAESRNAICGTAPLDDNFDFSEDRQGVYRRMAGG
jgi:hypothetical protein